MTPTYDNLISQVIALGLRCPSRFGDSTEVRDARVVIRPGEMVERKNFSRRLGFMELLLVLAGVHDPELIKRVAPKAQLELFTKAMSYGPILKGQIPLILKELRVNPDTRQAVMFVGGSDRIVTSSLPCTSTIQFLRRDGLIHTYVTMRSWDAVKGLPYDIMVFGGIAQAVAHCLYLKAGLLSISAASLHVYTADVSAGLSEGGPSSDVFSLRSSLPTAWEELRGHAYEAAQIKWDKVPPIISVTGPLSGMRDAEFAKKSKAAIGEAG